MPCRQLSLLLVGVALATAPGCILADLWPVENCDASSAIEVTGSLVEWPGARLRTLPRPDALGLEVDRGVGIAPVGAYLSPSISPRGSLILLLCGASTLHEGGRPAAALSFHRSFGGRFAAAGFRVLTPALSETAAYGDAEVDEVLAIIHWLQDGGLEALQSDRLFVVGYSTGATLANLINHRAEVDAVVSLGGLSEPRQFFERAALYRAISDLFPCNQGMAQVRTTLDTYERRGWAEFDAVARVSEVLNPTLYVHVEDDLVHLVYNARDLEQAYASALGTVERTLPQLDFCYVERGGHFVYVEDSALLDKVIDYLSARESR